MSKVLMVVVILFLIYFFFLRKSDLLSKNKETKEESSSKTKSNSDSMVECAKCNIFLSPNESILANGQHFCSKECAGLE